MKKFLITLGVLVALVGFLQVDDELDPGAQALLDKARSSGESRAFLYLLGMDAPVGEDPETEGRERLALIRQAEAGYAETGLYDFASWDKTNLLPSPRLDLFCDRREADCRWGLTHSVADLQALLDQNKELLRRYREYTLLGDYFLMAAANTVAPLPSFGSLVNGSKLMLMEAIVVAEQGDLASAASLLSENMQGLRQQFSQSDTLIHGMILLAAMANAADTAALMVQRYPEMPMANLRDIGAFDVPMEKWLAHELEHVESFRAVLEQRPQDFLPYDLPSPAWLPRTVLKWNMVMNVSFSTFEKTIATYEAGPASFDGSIGEDWSPSLMDWIRNPVGTELNQANDVAFDDYIGRVFDLGIKLEMLDALIASEQRQLDGLQVPNAYSGAAEMLQVESANSGWYCLSGPALDKHRYRCLPQLAGKSEAGI